MRMDNPQDYTLQPTYGTPWGIPADELTQFIREAMTPRERGAYDSDSESLSDNNPYSRGTEEHAEWRAGFLHALGHADAIDHYRHDIRFWGDVYNPPTSNIGDYTAYVAAWFAEYPN